MSKPLERLFFVPDTHVPYHDEHAWQTVLAAARAFKPTILVVLGDFWDCYACSFHSRDPRRATMVLQELEVVEQKRKELDALKAKRKIFIAGNHEYRLDRYIQDRAPALYGITSVPKLLKLRENNWEYVPYQDGINIGKLYVTHELGSAGAGAIKKARADAETNVVIGHIHRMGSVYEANARGVPKVGAAFGWLGDFETVDYMHRRRAQREWVHGCGTGYMDSKGHVYLQGVPVVDGQACIEGKIVGKKR